MSTKDGNSLYRVLFLLFCLSRPSLSTATTVYNVGGLFSTAALEAAFNQTVEAVSTPASSLGLQVVRLNASSALLNADPLVAINDICNKLINNSVYLVITDHALNSTRPPFIVSYACAFYNIPVIGVSARDIQFSDKVSVATN